MPCKHSHFQFLNGTILETSKFNRFFVFWRVSCSPKPKLRPQSTKTIWRPTPHAMMETLRIGLNLTQLISSLKYLSTEAPNNFLFIKTTCFSNFPVCNSKIRRIPSFPPDAKNFPFGEIETELTQPKWERIVISKYVGCGFKFILIAFSFSFYKNSSEVPWNALFARILGAFTKSNCLLKRSWINYWD